MASNYKKLVVAGFLVGLVIGCIVLSAKMAKHSAINDAEDQGTSKTEVTETTSKTDDSTDTMCQDQPDPDMPAELNAFLSRDESDIVADLNALMAQDTQFPTTITDPPSNPDEGVQSWLLNTNSVDSDADTKWIVSVTAAKSADAVALMESTNLVPTVVKLIPATLLPPLLISPPVYIGTDSVYTKNPAIIVFETATYLDSTDTISFNLCYKATGAVMVTLEVVGQAAVTLEPFDESELHSQYASAEYTSPKQVTHQEYVPGGSLMILRVIVQNDTAPSMLWMSGSAVSTIPNNFTPFVS